jgi:hypothetical protein
MAEKIVDSSVPSKLKCAQFSAKFNDTNPMDLKVVCYCGQKYKFDVEPVDGRMPHAINCPVCGVDGTPLANQLISQQLSGSAMPPVPAMAAPAPMAVPASAMAAPPPIAPAPMRGGLRVNIAQPAIPAVPPPLAPSSVPPPLGSSRPMAPVKPAEAAKQPKEYNQGLGILGAFLGAAIGGGLTYGFYALTDFRFPLMGTAIGALAGVGARVMARGTDSTLGFIAAALALVSVVGVLFLMYGSFSVSSFITIAVAAYFAYRIAS